MAGMVYLTTRLGKAAFTLSLSTSRMASSSSISPIRPLLCISRVDQGRGRHGARCHFPAWPPAMPLYFGEFQFRYNNCDARLSLERQLAHVALVAIEILVVDAGH